MAGAIVNVDVAMKIYRGIWGVDKKVTDTEDRPTVGATSNQKVAQAYADRKNVKPPEGQDVVIFDRGHPQVFEMTVTPRNPVTFDQEYVTVNQLQSKFDLDPQETQSLMERFGDGGVDINELGDDPMFIDMMRAREVDLLISPEGVPGMNRATGDNAMNTGESYRVIDKKIIQNSKRVTQYMVDDVGFFSPARRVVEMSEQAKGDAGYWKKILTEGLGEIRPKNAIYPKKDADEIGVFDFLDSIKGSITREKLLGFIDANRLQLSEHIYQGKQADIDEQLNSFDWIEPEIERGPWQDNEVEHHIEYLRDDFKEHTSNMDSFREWLDENGRSYMVEADMVEGELDDLRLGSNDRYVVADDGSRGTFIYEEADLEDYFLEQAEAAYEDNPVLVTYNQYGYSITGNDEWGYTAETPRGVALDVNQYDHDIYDLQSTRQAANLHAIESGEIDEIYDGEGVNSQWFPDFTISTQAREEGTNPKNILIMWDKGAGAGQTPDSYHHKAHFSEENYFAHARTEERVVDGKQAFHIDEIQTDWHHEGVDQGMLPDPRQSGETRLFYGNDLRVLTDDGNKWFLRDSNLPDEPPRIFESKEALLEFVDQTYDDGLAKAKQVKNIIYDPVPYAPFGKNWDEMMFKRAIAEALRDPNIERITWTTANTQADRYKSVEFYPEVSLQIEDQNKVTISYTDLAENKGEITYDIREMDLMRDRTFRTLSEAQRKEFEELRESALISSRSSRGSRDHAIYPQQVVFKDVRTQPSKGFSVLYDQKMPKFSQKLLKRYGAKVGKTRIESKDFEMTEDRSGFYVEYLNNRGNKQSFGPLPSEEAAKQFMETRGNIEVWYFDITPEMRQDFMENGIPLTQNGDDDNEQERMVA
jgi:hypothetical protein